MPSETVLSKWVYRLAPFVMPLAVLAATTGILYALDVFLDPEHLIFGYLVPTTLIAVAYGSRAAMLTSVAGVLLAAYFLYDPEFSFYVSQPLHIAELVFFTLLALMASQVVAKITDTRRRR
jgi:two-component system, OmpR family, sensor histidine kinase KdpD